MKRLALFLLAFAGVFACTDAGAQIIEKAGAIFRNGIESHDTADISHLNTDSARLNELEALIQEMRLNEIMLRSELDAALNANREADSLRLEMQRQRIDSLRAITPGSPVTVDGDTLFMLYANRGGYNAANRAEMASEAIAKAGKYRLSADSLYLLDNGSNTDIMYGNQVIISLTEQDALWQSTTHRQLAADYMPLLQSTIDRLHSSYNLKGFAIRALLFILVIAAQYLLIRLTNYLFRRLRRRIIRYQHNHLKSVFIREYELLNRHQLTRIIIFFSNILRYAVLLIQLTITVPILFAIFPQTEKLALRIFLYIIEPVKMVFTSVVEYIPNLFIIMVIWLCIHYLVKGVRYIATEIENEKLKISGFYPDWAKPTFNIIRVLLYAFMIAMIYPYLPGSDSGVFQGISVFVGLIISLGSSTVIGNIIAGLVITYMRPFKLGDRIKLNDTTGNVIEKTAFVTRLRTTKNEVVTIPNSFIMSTHTVNYSASARNFGLIIHTTVTIGYDVPWRQVHQLLIDAARMTPGVEEHPKPFVLETELQDYYPCYQINAYIREADKMGDILTELHQNIQDCFNEAGVEIMSPKFVATRDGNESTIPAEYRT